MSTFNWGTQIAAQLNPHFLTKVWRTQSRKLQKYLLAKHMFKKQVLHYIYSFSKARILFGTLIT